MQTIMNYTSHNKLTYICSNCVYQLSLDYFNFCFTEHLKASFRIDYLKQVHIEHNREMMLKYDFLTTLGFTGEPRQCISAWLPWRMVLQQGQSRDLSADAWVTRGCLVVLGKAFFLILAAPDLVVFLHTSQGLHVGLGHANAYACVFASEKLATH